MGQGINVGLPYGGLGVRLGSVCGGLRDCLWGFEVVWQLLMGTLWNRGWGMMLFQQFGGI